MSRKGKRESNMSTALSSVAVSLLNSPNIFSPSRLYGTPSSSSVSQIQEKAKEGNDDKRASMWNRKRPSRICIPAVATTVLESGTWRGYEKEEGIGEVEVEAEGEGYSVYSRKGKRRKCLEDRFSAVVGVEEGSDKQAFFGVFDGHGGAKAADFVAEHLNANVREQILWNDSNIQKAVRDAYLKTDEEFTRRNHDDDKSGGTCGVSSFIFKGSLVVSNAGDCRAVISRGGVAEALTTDHRPSVESERERIQNNGGYVDCCNGVWRIQGSLAVSRSIGDRHLKQWIIAEPDTTILPITPRSEFLILASDGLWDKVSNQEAIDVARPLLVGDGKSNQEAIGVARPLLVGDGKSNQEAIGVARPLLVRDGKGHGSSACRKLAELSASRGSRDDITVMIVELGRFIDSNSVCR